MGYNFEYTLERYVVLSETADKVMDKYRKEFCEKGFLSMSKLKEGLHYHCFKENSRWAADIILDELAETFRSQHTEVCAEFLLDDSTVKREVIDLLIYTENKPILNAWVEARSQRLCLDF